ncbi:DUF2764 family protein [Parendozoicomonas haliclonae]|uniref:V-type ATP synthase subunit C n=1 Tax=Parendozoicomonas haliclonae TaxID=1960125 RepID=A0A1X7AID2_9GAMM|nr:DUF2764 family protein [Parendozoicomonas haliclonae]SMA43460.1 hypothetical protein EHSB41UT_01593 [Parendozoicomonas haliclonae]
MAESAYYTLLTSLPHIDSLFSSKMTPISRFQLDKRLSMLGTEDQQKLVAIENLLHWDHMGDEVDEKALILQADRLKASLGNQHLIDLINWRLDIRTVTAALRRKHAGQQAPSEAKWSYGTRYEYIRTHWTSPTLGLSGAFPWIPKVNECLRTGECVALEKVLLQAAWNHLTHMSMKHRNDFVAVVIYVMRWNLVARWTAYDTEQARVRFRDLVERSLGAFKDQLPASNH